MVLDRIWTNISRVSSKELTTSDKRSNGREGDDGSTLHGFEQLIARASLSVCLSAGERKKARSHSPVSGIEFLSLSLSLSLSFFLSVLFSSLRLVCSTREFNTEPNLSPFYFRPVTNLDRLVRFVFISGINSALACSLIARSTTSPALTKCCTHYRRSCSTLVVPSPVDNAASRVSVRGLIRDDNSRCFSLFSF